MIRSAALAVVLLSGSVAFAAPVPIGKAPRGQPVTVSGKVMRITDADAFRLKDASGVVTVYVGPNDLPVQVGEEVTVLGALDEGCAPEFVARALRRADGSEVSFRYDWG
ncbi:MAG: hypothetical protein RIR62_2452 [Pseudomonadota bacterium]|jgi:uncharacterized protein YdeI (BOF family)